MNFSSPSMNAGGEEVRARELDLFLPARAAHLDRSLAGALMSSVKRSAFMRSSDQDVSGRQ
jgi:hypothetical protein